MSKILHAKPAWGWSVVLLSTLLLSPVAGTAALQALLLAQTQAAVPQTPASAGPNTGGQQPVVPSAQIAPRRADEGWMLRLRAQGARPFTLRLDAHPDVIAVLVPARTVLFVPDEAARAPRIPVAFAPPSFRPRTDAPPRAPPTA